jgi:hypothetical protein
MLSPHGRTSLFGALRPPEGFAFDAAAGTSFSLDLEALLTAPIAFALHEARHADPGEGEVEPVGLLESVRRHAARITLFCQGGQIAVPARRRPVFAWLEDGVVEVAAPRPGRLFHPKVWAARYRAVDGDACVLRVLCATRNLTFDPSWDTLLRVESEPYTPRAAGPVLPAQAELAELLRRLPDFAHRRPDEGRVATVTELADEVAAVPLVAPEPFNSLTFHVLGLEATSSWPLPEDDHLALVISPFLGETFLDRLTSAHDVAALISREESLDQLPPATLAPVERIATLNPAVDAEPAEATAESTDDGPADQQAVAADPHGDPGRKLAGLHAKLFLFDTNDGARVFTGSANATAAAFDGNVEILAELEGPPSVRINALLADTPGETGLADLLMDYQPHDEPVTDEDADELEARIDGLRHELAAMTLTAGVAAYGDDYVLRLGSHEALPAPAVDDLELHVWPVTLDEASSARPLIPGEPVDAQFTVTLEGITSFLAVRATARRAGARQSTMFLVNAELLGAPADRHSRLLAAMLRDRDRLLRYLLLLLYDESAVESELSGRGAGWVGRWLGAGWDELPLLELLLRALDRHPERLDHIAHLLDDLADQRDELLPHGFDAVWQPIWQHRREARR